VWSGPYISIYIFVLTPSLPQVRIHENTRKNLENEIAGYMAAARKQRDTIEQLEAERDRYEQEAVAAQDAYTRAVEELKMQEGQVLETQKRIIEGEAKLKQQQNLYEAVRSDRNLYSKNLIESQVRYFYMGGVGCMSLTLSFLTVICCDIL
jgi:hypothetical protein